MNHSELNLTSDCFFIGVGGAGSNLARLFEEKGYEAMMINSSSQDLSSVKAAKRVRKLSGYDGSAGERNVAKNALADNQDILDEIAALPYNILFVCFSSGGGTGSGLGPSLASILAEETEKTVCQICILPDATEEYGAKLNTAKCFGEIVAAADEIPQMGTVFFADNNYGSKKQVNEEIFRVINQFLSNRTSSALGNVDQQERRVILASNGAMVIYTLTDTEKTARSSALDRLLSGKNVFAAREDDQIVTYTCVINQGDHRLSKSALSSRIGIPERTFEGFGSRNTIVAFSGLSFPMTQINEIAKDANERAKAREAARASRRAAIEAVEVIEQPKPKRTQPQADSVKNRRAALLASFKS
ncbi:MAG: hypothetical protein IKS18_07625 [Lachnospiraceae bacterium]|nr:hypothetical protein [Lachnospiraceae bacterium]